MYVDRLKISLSNTCYGRQNLVVILKYILRFETMLETVKEKKDQIREDEKKDQAAERQTAM